jgi:hypothetical protein
MWAAGGTCARETVALTRDKHCGSAEVRLPATCSSAVHGCQMVMIRAAAPNLLQVRAGRRFHLQDVLLPNKVQRWQRWQPVCTIYCCNPAVSLLTEDTTHSRKALVSVSCIKQWTGSVAVLDAHHCSPMCQAQPSTLDCDCLMDACKCVQSHTVP